MSILKFINRKARRNEKIKTAIDYVMDSRKTNHELIKVNGVQKESAWQDMQTIQELTGTASGRRYIHYVISMERNVSSKVVYEIAVKASEYYADAFPYILAVHTNTDNPHAHVILCATNVKTGKKFSQSKKDMLRFREFLNNILESYGLNRIEKESLECDMENLSHMEREFRDEFLFFDVCQDEMNLVEEDFTDKNSFFDVCQDEIDLIEEAEQHEKEFRNIIAYFEGDVSVLPDRVSYDWAYDSYIQWKDAVDCSMEEVDEKNSFFSRNGGR